MPHRNQMSMGFHSFFQQPILCGLRTLTIFVLLIWACVIITASPLSAPSGPTRISVGQHNQDGRVLGLNKPPIEEDLSGGQSRDYPLALTKGQYVEIVVEQRGIDVVVTLFGPDGKEIVKVDSPNGIRGPESVWTVVKLSGNYRLEVRSPDTNVPPGRYEVKTVALRTASQEDIDRVAGQQALEEAAQLQRKGDEQSLRRAIAKYEESVRLFHSSVELRRKGEIRYLIGKAYQALHDPQKTLENFYQAWQILRSFGNIPILGATLSDIGATYAILDLPDQALEHYEQALSVFQSLPDQGSEAIQGSEATLLNNIGQANQSLGKKDEALKYYEQALPIMRSIPNHPDVPTVLNNIGQIYFAKGNAQQALKHYDEALSIFRERNNRSGEAGTLNNIGQVKGADRKEEALKDYTTARQIFHELGERSNEVKVLGNIGTLNEDWGRQQAALDAYQIGIDMLESLRESATVEEIRASLSESSAFVYKASLLLMSMGQPIRAFNLTERARARTLLDQLGNVHPNPAKTIISPEEQALQTQIASLEQRLGQERIRPLNTLNNRLVDELNAFYEDAQRRYEGFLRRQKLVNQEPVSSRSIQPLTLPEVQMLLSKDVTLLSYFIGPYKSLAFIITRDSFQAVELEMKEPDILEPLKWFRSFPTLSEQHSEGQKRLYGSLIAPLKQYIKTPTVGIIPHRTLHYLPFAALSDGRNYFGGEHTLFYLPSASVIPFIQKNRKQGKQNLFALAQDRAEWLPALSYANQSAKTIAKLFNTKAFVGKAATESAFRSRAGESRILFLAAHAELSRSHPLFSRIFLAPDRENDGMLKVHEVYGLDLAKADLIVLSACQTQLGEHSLGDDIVGLNRAFIYAGTPTVVASLWSVQDKQTGELMVSFFKHLRGGMSKAEALQAAQREVRAKYPHPYYWAGFVLTGDPGAGNSVDLTQNKEE